MQHHPLLGTGRHEAIVSLGLGGRCLVACADVSTAPSRVFAARLVGLPIFDPQGDQVAKVRDLVVSLRADVRQPRVLGLVAEVFGRRRIFVPMTRVTHVDSGQVYTTGLLNMRRFEQRPTETLVVGQMFDRTVTVHSTGRLGHGLRRRHRAGPQPRLGAEPGRAAGARQGPAPARPDARRGVGRRRRLHPARGQPGRHPPAGRAQRDEAGRRGQRDPRPAGRATHAGGRRDSTTSGSPTSSRSCPRRTRSRSSSTSRPSGPPTCSARCHPTTPPT